MGSESQRQPQLCGMFEASLGYVSSFLSKPIQTKSETVAFSKEEILVYTSVPCTYHVVLPPSWQGCSPSLQVKGRAIGKGPLGTCRPPQNCMIECILPPIFCFPLSFPLEVPGRHTICRMISLSGLLENNHSQPVAQDPQRLSKNTDAYTILILSKFQ